MFTVSKSKLHGQLIHVTSLLCLNLDSASGFYMIIIINYWRAAKWITLLRGNWAHNIREHSLLTVWSSEPEARYFPRGCTEMLLMIERWPLNIWPSHLGKGCRSLGSGNTGSRSWKSDGNLLLSHLQWQPVLCSRYSLELADDSNCLKIHL